MKRLFTQIFGAALLITLVMQGMVAQSKTIPATGILLSTKTDSGSVITKADSGSVATPAATKATVKAADATTWTPVRRLWGYSFGDFYYDQRNDQANRGGETMYNGVPTGRNAFQFRRIYLGYDYDISPRFTAEVLLASEPSANTTAATGTTIQNGDDLVDGKMGLFIKNFNLRYRNIFTGADLVFGEMSTPGFALNEPGTNGPTTLSEKMWGYRSIEKTITDFHKTNSYDVGVSLQGVFDPSTKNYGYVFMVGNNSTSSLLTAANANTGFYKMFYGDVWGKFLDSKLVVDLYADYVQTAPSTGIINPQSHNVLKAFVAYSFPQVTIGVEAYTQSIAQAVTNSQTKLVEDATVQAMSIWARGPIIKDKLGFFARFDTYNPDTDYNTADSYTVNTNFGSYTPTVKEQFYTAGLDFTPEKNIHFMPNFWTVYYRDQRDPATAGYLTNDHSLVYRLTFFYTFGK